MKTEESSIDETPWNYAFFKFELFKSINFYYIKVSILIIAINPYLTSNLKFKEKLVYQ